MSSFFLLFLLGCGVAILFQVRGLERAARKLDKLTSLAAWLGKRAKAFSFDDPRFEVVAAILDFIYYDKDLPED